MAVPTSVVRAARLDDVEHIVALLKVYSDQNVLLPRTVDDVYRAFREFIVLETNGKIVGCVALQIFTLQLGEVRSLAVDQKHSGKGYGSQLLQNIEQQALEVGLKRLMALTYVEKFFAHHGFTTVSKRLLPEKVWGVCNNCCNFLNCNEIAVLKIF